MIQGRVKINAMENEMDAEGHAPVYHDQLPSVEEARSFSVREGSTPYDVVPSRRKRRMLFALLAFGVLVAVIIGVAVGVSKNSSESPSMGNVDTNTTTDEGTNTTGEPFSARMEEVVAYLSNNISDADALKTDGTPQYRAAKWIADEDYLVYEISNGVNRTFPFLQRYALAVLYYATGGDNWKNKLKFLTGDRECDWFERGTGDEIAVNFGVKCRFDEIESIVLEDNGLVGELPGELKLLTKLDFLWVPDNSIEGTLPNEFRSLTVLDTLNLDGNQMTGEIQPWIKHWTKLTVLSLQRNEFKGTIPTEIGLLSVLERLMLEENQLEGNVPSELRHLTNLDKITLANNRLTGELSDWITMSLNNMSGMRLSNNKFTGTLPETLWNLTHRLEVLDLHGNAFSGQFVPIDMKENNVLKFLDLHDNNFNHKIPSSILNLPKLKHLDLSSNKLTGTVSFHLRDLTDLEYLFLGNNTFNAEPIPELLQNLTNVRELSLREINMEGPIPEWIANLDKLVLLDLDGNKLTGTVPNLGNHTSLKYLLLSRNLLNGTVPSKADAIGDDLGYLCDGKNPAGSLNKVFADCGGENPEIECTCCTCCEGGAETCNDAQINPDWDTGYVSFDTDFFTNKLSELF